MPHLLTEIRQTMSHNKLRTALTGLSVAWGIFMLIVLLGASRGVTANFEEFAGTSASKVIQIWGGTTSVPYRGHREGRSIEFRDVDRRRLAEQGAAYSEEVSAVIYGEAVPISAAGRYVTAEYTGMDPSAQQSDNLKLLYGRFISPRDMRQGARVVVLSDNTATNLFPDDGEKVVGKRVDIRGLSFLVVGVHKGNWYQDNIIPYTTARSMQKDKTEVGSLKVTVDRIGTTAEGEAVEKDIRRIMAEGHNFDPDDEGALWVNNRYIGGLRARAAVDILNVGVWVLGLLSLLSGIIGISNIMFVSVKERAHEIGIRRAIGARPRSILMQIIAEAVAVTVTFGYIGIVLGTAVTQLLAAATAGQGILDKATVSLGIAFEVTLVLVVAGALAGLFPALKALKVKPVEALHDE